MERQTNFHIFKGLPASGKTTEALKLIKNYGRPYTRVNRNNLRELTWGTRKLGGKVGEKTVTRIRRALIQDSLNRKIDVICDDTNLSPKRMNEFDNLIHICRWPVKKIVHDLTDVHVEECLKRDLKREHTVGRDVILRMWNQFIVPTIPKVQFVPGLPEAIIVDVDGTLATMHNRHPFELSKVKDDLVKKHVRELVRMYHALGITVIILTGRDGVAKSDTIDWIIENEIPYDLIYNRAEGDCRPDYVIKKELFDNHIRNKYNVKVVLDDRPQVIRMWVSLGLNVFRVDTNQVDF